MIGACPYMPKHLLSSLLNTQVLSYLFIYFIGRSQWFSSFFFNVFVVAKSTLRFESHKNHIYIFQSYCTQIKMLFTLTNCPIYFLNAILACYILIFTFSIKPGITHFSIISVYPYSILATIETSCKVYQNSNMRAVNKYFSFTLYKC